MGRIAITGNLFLEDSQRRTFTDVVDVLDQPFDAVLAFSSLADRQRQMEESEIHHDRSPLAGMIRELEAEPAMNQFLADIDSNRSKRLRQAIGDV